MATLLALIFFIAGSLAAFMFATQAVLGAVIAGLTCALLLVVRIGQAASHHGNMIEVIQHPKGRDADYVPPKLPKALDELLPDSQIDINR